MRPIYLDCVQGIKVKSFVPETSKISPLHEKGGLLFAVGIVMVCCALGIRSWLLGLVGLATVVTGMVGIALRPKIAPEQWLVEMGDIRTVDMLRIAEEYEITKENGLYILTKKI